MANRTAILVFATAAVMVVASFSFQSERALAYESAAEAIAEIESIRDVAGSAMDARVLSAATEISGQTTEAAAAQAANTALEAIDSIFWAAGADMAWVAGQALWAEPVVAAGLEAAAVLEGRAGQAYAEISGMFDAWVAAHSAPTAVEVIAAIEQKLQRGLNKIDGIIGDYNEELEDADSAGEAAAERDEALAALAERVAITSTRLDNQLALLPDDPAVQAAHAQAVADLDAASAAATSTIHTMFDAFVGTDLPVTTTTVPPTTTTTSTLPATTTTLPPTTATTAPPTTTTTPPTTTTTTMPQTTSSTMASPPRPTTTTTTLAPAAALPDLPPPPAETLYMAELPAPVVLSSDTLSSMVVTQDSSMATVGMVRRVVDSQLPVGVSTVAAGPFVVLGLIVDAIRAAGAFMAVPWLLLSIYVAGLLRSQRNPMAVASQG